LGLFFCLFIELKGFGLQLIKVSIRYNKVDYLLVNYITIY